MDIKLIITRTSSYIIIISLFILVFVFGYKLSPFPLFTITFVGIVGLLFGEEFRKNLQTTVSEKWISDYYNPLSFNFKLFSKLAPVLEPPDLLSIIRSELRATLQIPNIYCFRGLLEPSTNSIKGFKHCFQEKQILENYRKEVPTLYSEQELTIIEPSRKGNIKTKSKIIHYLETAKRVLKAKNIDAETQQDIIKLGIEDAQIYIPFYSHERLEAFIILGSKKSGTPYNSDDFDIFKWLCNQSPLIWSRIVPHEKVKVERLMSVEIAKKAAAYKDFTQMYQHFAHAV